mgnify:FL=1
MPYTITRVSQPGNGGWVASNPYSGYPNPYGWTHLWPTFDPVPVTGPETQTLTFTFDFATYFGVPFSRMFNALLYVNADDGCKVWVNGTLIHTDPYYGYTYHAPPYPWESVTTLNVFANMLNGMNTLVAECKNWDGATFPPPPPAYNYAMFAFAFIIAVTDPPAIMSAALARDPLTAHHALVLK